MLIQTSSIYKSSIFFLLKNDKDVAIWARMSLNAILSYGRTRFPWAQLQIPTALPLSAFRPSCHTIFLSTILSHCITSLRILYSLEPQLNWNGEERIKHPYTYQFKKIFLSFLCPLCYDRSSPPIMPPLPPINPGGPRPVSFTPTACETS